MANELRELQLQGDSTVYKLNDARITTTAVSTATHFLATDSSISSIAPITAANLASVLGGIYTSISSNSDFNEMTAIGTYICVASSITATLSNKPAGLNYAFTMKIIMCPGALYIAQIVIENSTSKIFIRQCAGNVSSWTSWKQIAFQGE